MKVKKLFLAGAFLMGLAMPISAQNADYNAQLEVISKALKADPNNVNAAKDQVKDYLKIYKKDPAALVALGSTYLGVKNYDKANLYADMALKKNKTFGDAYVLKGDIEAMKDDGGQAAMWYQQAMTQDPKNPNGYMSYANVYRKRSPEESERVLNELRKNVPDFPIEAEAAHTFYTSGQYEKAMEYFSKADISKLSEGRIGEYVLTALSLKEHAKGLEVAEQAISKFPTNMGFVRLALINGIGAQKFDNAIGYAEKLLASGEDTNAGDHTYYGQALAGAKRYTEAIEQYQKALQMDEKSVNALQLISEAYSGLGNEDKALEFAQEYLAKNPNAKVSEYNKLAGIYMAKVKKGEDVAANFGKAKEVYDNLATKFPQIATWAQFQKGYEAYKAELDDDALVELGKLITTLEGKGVLDEDETGYLKNAYRSVGYIHWGSKNDLETARPYFEKLYKLDPNDSLAKKALGLDEENAQ